MTEWSIANVMRDMAMGYKLRLDLPVWTYLLGMQRRCLVHIASDSRFSIYRLLYYQSPPCRVSELILLL